MECHCCNHDAFDHEAVNDPEGPSGQLGRCRHAGCTCTRFLVLSPIQRQHQGEYARASAAGRYQGD